MTLEQRVGRLEKTVEKLALNVSRFVKDSGEHHAALTEGFKKLTQVQIEQAATIRRLDEMITRFDAWMRGQGPQDGRGRR